MFDMRDPRFPLLVKEGYYLLIKRKGGLSGKMNSPLKRASLPPSLSSRRQQQQRKDSVGGGGCRGAAVVGGRGRRERSRVHRAVGHAAQGHLREQPPRGGGHLAAAGDVATAASAAAAAVTAGKRPSFIQKVTVI